MHSLHLFRLLIAAPANRSMRSLEDHQLDRELENTFSEMRSSLAMILNDYEDPRPALLLIAQAAAQLVGIVQSPALGLEPPQRRRSLAHTLRRLDFPQEIVSRFLREDAGGARGK